MDEDAIEEIYEADCIVGVKWGRHKHGVEKGKKPEHIFKTRWNTSTKELYQNDWAHLHTSSKEYHKIKFCTWPSGFKLKSTDVDFK